MPRHEPFGYQAWHQAWASSGTTRRSILQLSAGAAALGFLPFTIPFAEAQDISNGADNFYVSDRVTIEKVTFRNQYGMTVAGNLFMADDLDRGRRHGALVVGHPMGAVKEQSANLYATRMAEQGFVTN